MARIYAACVFFFVASSCAHSSGGVLPNSAPALSYEVSINDALSRIDVHMCTGAGRCSDYQVNTLERTGSLERDPMMLGHTLLIPTERFLRAPRTPFPFPYRVRFGLPANVAVSVPWPEDDDGYRVEDHDFRFNGFAVFGRFDRMELEVGTTTLDVVLPEDAARMDHDLIRAWLTSAADVAGKLTGFFPVAHAQIIVVQVPSSESPVPFGMAYRGGGASVILLVAANANIEELRTDWVAIHELTHLSLPFIRERDAWFSEGYATYFQEALLMHAGLRSEADVRAALAASFERARNAGTGRTLADETRARHTTRAYRRIYWAGAAIMMLADIGYHAAPNACGSLREAVHRAGFTRQDMSRVFAADEIIARLDAACGVPVLAQLRDRWLGSAEFPDVDATNPAALH